MKYFIWSFIYFAIGCTSGSKDKEQPDLSHLANNKALINITINDKDFYKELNVFDCKVNFSPNNFRINLLNEKNGNVIINLDKENWFKTHTNQYIKKGMTEFSETGHLELLVGKLLDNGGAEGYFFSNGTLEFLQLSKNLIAIEINGNLIKPGEAEIKENYKPIQGFVYIKSPEIQSDGFDLNLL
jgi:hypothetical protein